MTHPNIILFCTDQQRSDSLGCSGNDFAATPNIDRIAAAGTRLVNHRTPNPICSPSRASMFTGLYPRTHGLCCNGIALDPTLPTLPAILASSGYRTHGVGKFHLQPMRAPAELELPDSFAYWSRPGAESWDGPFYGFEQIQSVIGHGQDVVKGGHYARWLAEHHPDAVRLHAPQHALDPAPDDLDECWKSAVPPELHCNRWIARRAAAYIDTADEPFFLFVSFPDPHHPFAPPRPYCDSFDPADVPMPRAVEGELDRMPPYILQPAHSDEQGKLLLTKDLSESTLRRTIAHTYGMVQMIDDCVGTVLEALERRGEMQQTLIAFTSDHGELLGDHGLLRKGPPPYRQLLEVPMILKGPGIPAGRNIDALTSHIDLAPTLLDFAGIDRVPPGLEGVTLRPLLTGGVEAVRDAQYSEYHPRAAADLYNQTIRTDQWRLTLYPLHEDWGELFDMEVDPYEHENRFDDPSLSDVVKRLTERMRSEFPPRAGIDAPRLSMW